MAGRASVYSVSNTLSVLIGVLIYGSGVSMERRVPQGQGYAVFDPERLHGSR